MTLSLAHNDEAARLLADRGFSQAWQALERRCPWATGFQGYAFVSLWYRTYQSHYEPVLLFERDAAGSLIGLLPLAKRRDSQTVVVAGADLAEYQSWIHDPATTPDFAERALTHVSYELGVKRLSFRYLPPGTPLESLKGALASRCHLEAFDCPLMQLDGGRDAARSLAKKGNKSRLKRLARHGPVLFERIRDRAVFETFLESFAIDCDIRHAAVHGSLLFHDDPQRKPFLTALFDQGLLDVTVTRTGESVVGAHIGLRDSDRVYNGMLTHSPFDARNSPGKLHLLQLARDLGENGLNIFDLTTGDDAWKERFATDHAKVHGLTLHASRAACLAHRAARRSWLLGRDALRTYGTDPRSLKHRLHTRFSEGLGSTRAARLAGQWRLVDLPKEHLKERQSDHVACNKLSDLLLHATSRERGLRHSFLETALQRLEGGASCYTLARGDELAACLWLSALPGGKNLVVEDEPSLSHHTAASERPMLLARALLDAASWPGAGTVRIMTQAPVAGDRAVLRDLGLSPAMSNAGPE